MRAALLALLLASTAGAQSIEVVDTGTILTPDKRTLEVKGGAYFDHEANLANGQKLAALRAENEALKATPEAPPASLVATAVVCLLAGFAGGVALAVKLK